MEKNESIGPVIGLIIIIILIALGSVYFLGQRSLDGDTDTQTQEIQEQSSSYEISAIEEDLEDTDMESLDQELAEIEAELDAEL